MTQIFVFIFVIDLEQFILCASTLSAWSVSPVFLGVFRAAFETRLDVRVSFQKRVFV